YILAIPVISAFIGYLTNVVAIKLLFWPKKTINLGFFKLQGLLPKRQADIAVSLGELVEEQLLSLDEIFDQVDTPEVHEKIIDKINELLISRLVNIIPAFLPSRVVNLIAENLSRLLRQEAPNIINQVIFAAREYVTEEVKISVIVEDKVNEFDLDELEQMIRGISSTEIRFIEILGGVLGFIIGLFQLGFIYLFPM
ncbi:MAG TPA: DUF445 family protein, partial [Syntrophomonadaceae bacterium]|nr:DUF445 family protein [Syntrophomonadaceae bacterium]